MARRLLIVALTSMTLIGLELAWTRIFSAEFFYTFAFLTLSLAVLGLGLGALALRVFRGTGGGPDLAIVLSLAGLAALAGPPLVFRLGPEFSALFASGRELAKFLVTVLLLGLPFFLGGMALARIFRDGSREMPRLYRADLLGAAAGVALAIGLMNGTGTPKAVFLTAVPVVLAALLAARGRRRLLPLVPAAAAAVLGGRAESLLEARREEPAPVIYRHWDAMAKVKLYDFGGAYRGINIDNVANSPVVAFDNDWEAFRSDSSYGWDIDVGYLVARFDSCRFLSLGAGGGMDVLQALDEGAAVIHAVEVNPHLNRMMLEGDPGGYVVRDSTVADSTGRIVTLDEYSGHIYRDPRVHVVSEDARTYVRRHESSYDVIFSLSSNTWAALASGSFALAENYLFTTEAFRDYWRALTPDGFLSMEHQVYMPRLVSEVIDALESLGVPEPREHFAVYELPQLRRSLLLLSRRRLTGELLSRAYGPLTPERAGHIRLLYPAPDSLRGNLIDRIVTGGRAAAADTAAVDLSPATDDRPFVAQMGLWRNLRRDRLERLSRYAEFGGFPTSKLLLVVVLAVATVGVLPLMLLPVLRGGERLRAAPWLYFLLIGVGFMAIEVILIQQFTLFLGASVHAIATVLLALLLASGIGARFAGRIGARIAVLVIVAWLALDVLVFPAIAARLAFLGLPARVAVTSAALAPLGFFLGMPFPQGGLRVGPLIDWGFAVNGVGSVIGATLAVLAAITFGFGATLLGAAGVYLAVLLLASVRAAW